MLVFNSVSGSERRLECQVRRHKEYERHCVRLDNSQDILLNPPLSRNVKTKHGFHHSATGALLCPIGTDWNDPK
jgi:hypothetical protein